MHSLISKTTGFTVSRIRAAPIAGFVLGAALFAVQPAHTADIAGKWRTPAGAVIEIGPCGASPCGRITHFTPPPGHTLTSTPDANNKDHSKRSRKILGLTVLWALKPDGVHWRGRVYDPRRGISAKARLTPKDGRLDVQGCVKVVFNICETETWQRVR